MKKLLSLFLAMIMLLSLVPAAAFTSSALEDIALYWPLPVDVVAIGRISSKFGPRTAPTSGASTNHRGIDLPAPSGTPVYSVFDGVVTAVGKTNARGNYVVVHHPLIGYSSLYQHLTVANVQVGDTVVGGKQIAVSGNTGVGTGAHLHYGLMVGKATNPNHDQPGYNMAIDPMSSHILYVASAGGGSAVVTPSNNPDDFTVPTRNLYYTSPVMTGNDVKWVQAVLFQLGYTIGIDGSFGPATQTVVKQFQTDYGLDVDGSVGPATRTKLQELWNFKKNGNVNAELHAWVSTTEYGETPGEYFLKDTYYLNFELIDSSTGMKINSLVNKSYTVVMAFFNPDGSVHSTVTLASTDTGTLAAVPYDMGTYLAAVAVVGDFTLNYEFHFTATYNPTMTTSVDSVSLDITESNSQTFTLTLSGSYPDMRGIWFSLDKSVANATLGTVWNGSSIDVTVTGVGVGTTDLTMSLIEGHTGGNSTVGTVTIPVTVKCSHKSVTVHPAKASTCTVQGNAEYGVCNTCGVITYGSDAKLPLAGHTGGTATCTSKAVCTVCKAEYGSTNPSNHAGLQKVAAKAPTCAEIGWNAYEYCTKCSYTTYSELPATGNHTGGTATCTSKAVCTVCNAEYGSTNPSNHAGLKKVAAKAPTCAEIGWNAYEYCTKCSYTTYKELPATGNHTGGTATCNTQAICDTCTQPYGDLDPDNHAGETHVEGQKDATRNEEGYTGDTYCNDCGKKISDGEVIPKLSLRGDVDGDGMLTMTDRNTLGRFITGGGITFTSGADVNGDGMVSNNDLIMLGRLLQGATFSEE